MTSKYQQSFVVPDGFPALLKDFTREVLRDQPEHILEFAADWFAIKKQGGSMHSTAAHASKRSQTASQRALQHPSQGPDLAPEQAELADELFGLFKAADADGSGTLDRTEFAAVLQQQQVGLPARLINRMLAEADENADGVIDYSEFLPTIMDVIAIDATSDKSHAATERPTECLYGMPREQFEAAMQAVFQQADVDGAGTLTKQELKDCLEAPELGLARKDVNLLRGRAEVDVNGNVHYRDFAPMAYDLLAERVAAQAARTALGTSDAQLAALVRSCFSHFDAAGTGELTPRMARHALVKVSNDLVPLSAYQVHALLAMIAPPGEPEGMIKYERVLTTIARALHRVADSQAAKERAAAAARFARSDVAQNLVQRERGELADALQQAFDAADKDGSGMITGREAANVLLDLASDSEHRARFDPHLWPTLLAAVDSDTTGTLDWRQLTAFLANVLEHIEREKQLDGLQGAEAKAE